jgi:hypothetical protein
MPVAGSVTGPDLPGRVELVRAALPDADRARLRRTWMGRWTGPVDPESGPLGQVVEEVVAGGGGSRVWRWAATEARLRRAEALAWKSEPLEVEDAISRCLS